MMMTMKMAGMDTESDKAPCLFSSNRVGGGGKPPSSHSTVRTVRYTALSIVDVHRLIREG